MDKDVGSSSAGPAAPLRQRRSRIPLAVSRLRKSSTKVTPDAEGDIENTLGSNPETRQYAEHLEDGYASDTQDFAGTPSRTEELNGIEDDEGSEVLDYAEPGRREDEDEEESGLLAYAESSAEKFEDEDEEEDTSLQTSSLCQYTTQCNTGSQDYRKVISHIFGRNKKCTTQIPDSCWIIYCRKHYQRTRYRTSKAQVKNYFRIQFDNLARQLTRMEKWGGVRSWTIGLRKKEREILTAEDSALAQLQATGASIDSESVARVHRCRERYLLAYIGDNKTFDDVRRFIRAVEREVDRIGATELPGFELLPDIDLEEHPAGGARNTIKFETTRSSAKPSPKQTKQSASTSRDRSTSRVSNRRRLVQGTRPREDDEDDMKLEHDDEMECSAETAEIGEPKLLKGLSIKGQQRDKPAKQHSKDSRTTEEILEEGWFPKEERLKPPPSRSTTPKSLTPRSDSLRKEVGNRSAAKHHYPHFSERLGSPQSNSSGLNVRHINARKELGYHSKTPEFSYHGYDPWPKSTPEPVKARSVEPSTPVSDSNIQSTEKKGNKRPVSPATPMSSASSMDLTNDTKRARTSYSEPSKKPSSRLVVSSSPEHVAYRPATPKTPTRGDSSHALPEMRKFRTPQAPRTATHANRTPHAEGTPTPESNRVRGPHAHHSMTPQPRLSSPSPLRQRASPSPRAFTPINVEHKQGDDEEVQDVAS
ncbi:MAG: hypothetical protein Q9195_008500 [Heterodermia aff. obscurata]